MEIVPFSFVEKLLLDDRLGGALSRAGAAVQALLGIDLVVQLAHFDRLGGALSRAGAAGQALVSNEESHDITSVCFFDPDPPVQNVL